MLLFNGPKGCLFSVFCLSVTALHLKSAQFTRGAISLSLKAKAALLREHLSICANRVSFEDRSNPLIY